MNKKRKSPWTHRKVTNYIKDYRSMLTRVNRPLEEIKVFGDAGEILQSLKLFERGGFRKSWIGKTDDKLHIHIDVESLSKPKSRPYEVKVTAHKVDEGLYATSYDDMDHSCKDSQFSGAYRHRGGVKSPDHHEITARRTIERYLPKWCRDSDLPIARIKPIYKDISEHHKQQLLEILDKESSTLKSIKLREKIYVYLEENDIELYGLGD